MDYYEEIQFTCLLERIGEPLYLGPKGHGSTKYIYNLPPDCLKPYEVNAMLELRKLIPSTVNITEIPVSYPSVSLDLKPILEAVPRNAPFSEMHEPHLRAADELTKYFINQPTRTEFFNACALSRDVVNLHMWVHSFVKASLRRHDMHGFRVPALWEIMPDIFIEAKPWSEAVKQATLPPTERAVIVIDKNFSGTNLNPNHKVAYWTEDFGGNAHHWHWHIVNPFSTAPGTVDRKGEIFYYMHHGMLARYDSERLANGLNRVLPFQLFHDVIEEGYFPKLTMQNSSLNFAGRQEKSVLKDFDRSHDPVTNRRATLSDLRAWYSRVVEAIDAGFAIIEGGGVVDLRTENGIDVVTAMWESSFDSPHRSHYGVIHNLGHSTIQRYFNGIDEMLSKGIFFVTNDQQRLCLIGTISSVHDPDFRYKEAPGVMFFAGTSMRDAIFYRWHKLLDLISQRQKDYLPLYTQKNLQWNGIVVRDIQMIRREETRFPVTFDPINNMVTYWMQSDIEASRGLNFGRTSINGLESVWIRTTHLQHAPFLYRIRVTSQERVDVQATVRVFMAPKFDENLDKMPFHEQRVLFFEMDKFTTTLRPGENIITQNSENSTLTVPWSQTFREIERDTVTLTRNQAICSCGWPDHLLLPRGTVTGMTFDLFVMLTNHQVDQVPSSKRVLGTLTAKGTCRDSISYCGLIDDKIPDSRPMGYPFDRPATEDEKSKSNMFLADFVAPVPNMATTEVKIYHVDKTILRGDGAPASLRKMHIAP